MLQTSLQQKIVERIEREGPLTFADYMQMALYEPGYGYYVRDTPRIGWEGDYYTSSDIADFFAHCLGRQLYTMWQQLGAPSRFPVWEQGAGRGKLAESIRNWAAQEQPELSAALDYSSNDIRTGQDARNAPSSEQPAPLVLLSNELVDALPVHIVEKRGQQLYELYIDSSAGRLHEILSEPSSEDVATYLDMQKISWHDYSDGWRAEINLAALQWMRQAALFLQGSSYKRKKSGFLLAIDYGDKARELYTRHRYRGTLACYFHHQQTEQPLLRPGEQDITAHVNFSALIDEGRRQGLRLQKFTTQRQWLIDMGIEEELQQIRTRDFAVIDSNRASDAGQKALFQWRNLEQRVRALTDPNGMGNFKVLLMRR